MWNFYLLCSCSSYLKNLYQLKYFILLQYTFSFWKMNRHQVLWFFATLLKIHLQFLPVISQIFTYYINFNLNILTLCYSGLTPSEYAKPCTGIFATSTTCKKNDWNFTRIFLQFLPVPYMGWIFKINKSTKQGGVKNSSCELSTSSPPANLLANLCFTCWVCSVYQNLPEEGCQQSFLSLLRERALCVLYYI